MALEDVASVTLAVPLRAPGLPGGAAAAAAAPHAREVTVVTKATAAAAGRSLTLRAPSRSDVERWARALDAHRGDGLEGGGHGRGAAPGAGAGMNVAREG